MLYASKRRFHLLWNAGLVLNEDSCIKGSAGVVAAELTYVSAMDRIYVMRKRVMWDTIAGLPATQSIPLHTLHSMLKRFKDPSLFEIRMHVTALKYFES